MKEKSITNQIGFLLSIFMGLLSVIYSKGNYDTWDLLIAILIILIVRLSNKNSEQKYFTRLFSQISLAIAITIIIFFCDSFISVILDMENIILNNIRETIPRITKPESQELIPFDFIIFTIIFIILFMYGYLKKKYKKPAANNVYKK